MKKSKIIVNIILVAFAVCWVLPVLWMLVASVDTNASIFLATPSQLTIDNYKNVIASETNQRGFISSAILSVGVSVGVVICSGLAGYALSRYQAKYNRPYMLFVLFLTTLPGTVLIVPVYKMFIVMNMFDSLGAIILFLTATALPYSIWMMKNYMDGVPIALEEAAAVDGANAFMRIRVIVAPLVLPGICCVAIRAFSSVWGNFMTPYILLFSSEKYPASVMMYKYIGQHSVSYGTLAAFSTIYSIPSVLLYALSQTWMAKGFALSGANKG